MTDQLRRTFLRLLLSVGVAPAARASNLPDTMEVQGLGERENDLVARVRRFLTGLRSAELTPFLDQWPSVLRQRQVVPSSVPALRWLPDVRRFAPELSSSVVSALVAAAPYLAWRRSYTPDEVGASFLENYGWTELLGLTGPFASEHLACGFLLLGANVTYPRHRHEAEEIYVPLVGTARWQGEDGRWTEQSPGAVIHHARFEPHAMRTGASCLLAVYLWRSANLAQKSRLDPAPLESD